MIGYVIWGLIATVAYLSDLDQRNRAKAKGDYIGYAGMSKRWRDRCIREMREQANDDDNEPEK